jgi:hypothetical protein
VLLTGWLLVGQHGSLRQWQDAAALMRSVTAAIPGFVQGLDRRHYAALLLPDHVGAALVARNAEGALVMRPVQRSDYLDRVAGMTEFGIESWREALADHGLDLLRPGAPDVRPGAGGRTRAGRAMGGRPSRGRRRAPLRERDLPCPVSRRAPVRRRPSPACASRPDGHP